MTSVLEYLGSILACIFLDNLITTRVLPVKLAQIVYFALYYHPYIILAFLLLKLIMDLELFLGYLFDPALGCGSGLRRSRH
jgi:hypothetical protein